MTRLTLIAPLILAACAPAFDCPRGYVICDPATKRCICDRPTASLPDVVRGEAEDRPEAREPEHHGGEHHDPEPDREHDEAAHDAWQERNGL
jgi:hypothetical protein